MAISRVQATGSGNGGSAALATTVAAAAFGSSVALGDGLIAIVAGNGAASATTVSGVGDSTANVYSQFPGVAISLAGGETLDIWYCKNVTVGGALVPVATYSQATGGLLIVIEVTGQDKVTFIDRKASASGTGTAPLSGTAGATSVAGEFVIGATDLNSGAALSTGPTFSTALVSITTETLADNTLVAAKGALSVFDGILTSIAAETFSATSASHPWIAAVASFLPAATVVAGSSAYIGNQGAYGSGTVHTG